ncbi:MFS transporter [Paenibacillus lactis]|uniref:MFS transporter n=1 Tax=Paenibacillus lactis TaxID=228574 RepID=UPI0011A099B8
MTSEKKIGMVTIGYLLAIAVLGRILFIIPNKRYLNILNIEDFYVTSCLVIFVCALLIYLFVKGSPIKKLLSLIVVSIIIFVGFAAYFYASLPAYTYEAAVRKVETFETQSGKSVEVQIPENREDKLGVGNSSYLKMTHYLYYIYLNVDGKPVSYRFNPLDGQFEMQTERRLIN